MRSDPNVSDKLQSASSLSLYVDVESVYEVVSIPLPCLEGIWKKATELLNTPQSVALAYPDEARMVMSQSGHHPHLVLPCKGGHFKCDGDSLNFKSLGMCSHSVAVAELNKQLKEFIAAFTKSKRKANFSQLAMHGMPSGRGKKGSQAPRKRKQSQPIVERVDRISSAMNSTQSNASQIVGGSYNHMLNIHLDPPTPTGSMPSYSSMCSQGPSFMVSSPSYMSSTPPRMPSYHDWCEPLLPPPPPPPLPPMAQAATSFILTIITGNITRCAGCGNKYCKPAVPPYDVCVQHREWRSYTSPGGGPQSKFSPAYYHVNMPCFTRNWPHFSPRDLIVSREMWSKLTTVHKELLASFGYTL